MLSECTRQFGSSTTTTMTRVTMKHAHTHTDTQTQTHKHTDTHTFTHFHNTTTTTTKQTSPNEGNIGRNTGSCQLDHFLKSYKSYKNHFVPPSWESLTITLEIQCLAICNPMSFGGACVFVFKVPCNFSTISHTENREWLRF